MSASEEEEEELFARWHEGDKDAGTVLMARYYGMLERFFITKVSTGSSDLVHETLMISLEGKPKKDSFRSYLFANAHQVLRKRRYRRDRQDEPSHTDFSLADVTELASPDDPRTSLIKLQEKRLMVMALRYIPIQDQILLSLYHWEGFSVSQIAMICDVPSGTAKNRLRRAHKRFEEKLKKLLTLPNLINDLNDDDFDDFHPFPLDMIIPELDAWEVYIKGEEIYKELISGSAGEQFLRQNTGKEIWIDPLSKKFLVGPGVETAEQLESLVGTGCQKNFYTRRIGKLDAIPGLVMKIVKDRPI